MITNLGTVSNAEVSILLEALLLTHDSLDDADSFHLLQFSDFNLSSQIPDDQLRLRL